MKLLLIGDPHLSISKFDLSCKFLKWIGDTAKAVSPDLIVNLGDTFHNHAVLRSEIMGEFKKHISDLTKIAPYVYVLGNHDMYKPNDSKYHALQTFEDMEGFILVDERTDMFGISFIPYIPDMSIFPLDTDKICVAHQTFVGADYGFYRPDLGVDADKVEADIIISGHIHKRQSFGKVIYPGTPFAQNADDVNQSKGIMIFDTDTYSYSFIESPLPKWYSLDFNISQELSIEDMHKSIVDSINTVDNWLITITAPKAELSAYIGSEDVRELKKSASIRFRPSYSDKEKHTKIKIRSSSVDEIVSEYVDRIYKGSVDKSIVKAKALEVLAKIHKKINF